jgi:hypothetical protein
MSRTSPFHQCFGTRPDNFYVALLLVLLKRGNAAGVDLVE